MTNICGKFHWNPSTNWQQEWHWSVATWMWAESRSNSQCTFCNTSTLGHPISIRSKKSQCTLRYTAALCLKHQDCYALEDVCCCSPSVLQPSDKEVKEPAAECLQRHRPMHCRYHDPNSYVTTQIDRQGEPHKIHTWIVSDQNQVYCHWWSVSSIRYFNKGVRKHSCQNANGKSDCTMKVLMWAEGGKLSRLP